ncbi:hypothetical protein VOLCADRAFT_96193 [Volvox carteri f. nagariensis]|uniref:Uncharacterized protein n=1 Tax=Volvox carteri f. nagariensis TaxID=3068 RepID=D8U9G6_VOLCA|nr:uncharacterized protein VOLCADRAFT_96193 [Volvox carteri f. nagariensis]EFJ43581.1 hypothetical protein VOLCADRAFT_96193 [Volvox carteri f. nagariensis]|eukprot:XP_002955281.1 hypothetical protein VOLCADRAFT_96193 [Volvox carteri f. nagariensis]
MGSPLIEDFSDAAAFVQEDTSYTEQNASEDEVERKIAEEHAKFKEAYAKRQEEASRGGNSLREPGAAAVRASRPWSAPPVESPRPAQQKERERERKARGSNSDVDLDGPRSEYEPPVRPYLLQAQASGNNLSYLSRPQSAEHRPAVVARSINGHQPNRVSLSGIEEEAGEGSTWDSRQASEMGRLRGTWGDGASPYLSGARDDDDTGRDPFVSMLPKVETLMEEDEGELPDRDGTIPEEDEEAVEEEEGDEERGGSKAEGLGGRGGGKEQGLRKEGAEGPGDPVVDSRWVAEPSAEEVVEDEDEVGSTGAGGGLESGDAEERSPRRRQQQQQQLQPRAASQDGRGSSGVASGPIATYGNHQGDEERDAPVREDGEEEEEAQEGWRRQRRESQTMEEAVLSARGAPSVGASSAVSHALAMRGFVEPLKYDGSFSGGSAGRRSPAAGRMASRTRDGDEEENEYAEDSFEEDEELEEQDRDGDGEAQGHEGREQMDAAPSLEPLLSPSGEGSLLRASPSASKALLSSSMRSRAGSAVLAPLSKESSRSISVTSPVPFHAPLQPLSGHQSVAAEAGNDSPEGAPLPSPSATAPPSLPPIFRVTGSGAADTASVAEQLSGRAPLAASNSHRSISSNGSVIPTPSALAPLPAPQPALSELQPSQQFALQLLKHDIEVLPQHHRAAAEAAAARRKSSTVRPAGASLAAFGYLGYHLVSEKLTAPSGPAFRSVSPGRGTSPGRGDGGLNGSPSLIATRTSGPMETAASARSGGRPTSAPHMRPSSGVVGPETKAAKGDEGSCSVGDGGAAAAAAATAAVEGGGAGAPSGSGFVDMAREMRAGRLLPPVVVPSTTPRGGGGGNDEGPAVPSENSVSVMGESAINEAVSQSRMKFDVWLDALSGGGPAAAGAAGPSSNLSVSGGETERSANRGDAAAAAAAGHRPPRPMTAPASGRRRPVSARPAGNAAGIYMPAPAVVTVPKPLVRPMSAQPHHVRPTSASMSRGGGGGGIGANFDGSFEPPIPLTFQPPDAASAAGGTAAVEVGGVTVSVYVADTLKRIVEANRWLQQLGLATKRYRLKDRFSNMTIQMVEELPPLPSELAFGGGNDGGAAAVIKELTLKQFLSGHSKLKHQARKLRNAAAAAAAQQQPPVGSLANGAVYGIPEFGSGRPSRPISASFASVSGAGALTTPRARPSSAMPYNGGRTTSGSAGGADPLVYGAGSLAGTGGGGAAAQAGFQTGRRVRPSSANPSYGRTSAFGPYNSGSSPPAAPSSPFMHSAYAAHAAAAVIVPTTTKPPVSGGATAAAAGGAATAGFPQPRAAWGATTTANPSGSGYPSYQGHPATSGRSSGVSAGNGLPYMHRSTAPRSPAATGSDPDHTHTNINDDNDSEQALVVEPDEQGDVSRALRQQLGSASDYCQARRQEIARLRTLPLA